MASVIGTAAFGGGTKGIKWATIADINRSKPTPVVADTEIA
jgi:hypothetical protein